MNTTAKGNLLEDKVFEILSNLNESGIYGRFTKIFKHKKYFYTPTKKHKIIDVSIEQYLEEGDEVPSIIYAFECKNYDRKVDIGELEEFDSKLRGIAERAIKGAMVTTQGYSTPSLDFAKAKQLSLIKIVDDNLEYVLKREAHDYTLYNQYVDAMCNGSKTNCVYYGGQFLSLIDLLAQNGIDINFDKLFKIPYIQYHVFKEIMTKFRNSYGISIHDTLEEIIKKCDLKVSYVEMPHGLLGKLQISNGCIFLNSQLRSDIKRAKFTIAHEIGHWYLHAPLLKDAIESLWDTHDTAIVSSKTEQRMEIQANLFASTLLVPEEVILNKLPELFAKHDIHKVPLYVDNQRCNISIYHNIVGEFARSQNLSKAVIAYRLMNLNLLTMTPSAKSELL